MVFKSLKNKSGWKAAALFTILLFAVQVLAVFPKASAVAPNITSVRLDRLAKGTTTTGLVCLEPSVAGDAEGKLVLTFPAGFTVGASANWTTSTGTTTGWPTGAIAYPTISSGTASGQTVTFTSGDLSSASQVYCFNWTTAAALTTPSTTGSYAITVATQTSGGGALESNTATTNIVDTNCATSNPCDQIQVSASVNQSFTFTLSSNSAALGALSNGGVSATAINASVSTNAKSGWQMWAADPGSPVGLRSTTANYTIPYFPTVGSAAAVVTAGSTTEGYNIGAGTQSGTCNGSTSINTNFASGGVSFKGGGLDGTLRTVANSTGTASSCAVPLTVNAASAATTPAATDYAGVITVVAAGLF